MNTNFLRGNLPCKMRPEIVDFLFLFFLDLSKSQINFKLGGVWMKKL